jgi:hypothetical protein
VTTETPTREQRERMWKIDQGTDFLEHLDPSRNTRMRDGTFHFHTSGSDHIVWTGVAGGRVYTLQSGARTGVVADAVKALADALTAEAAAFFAAEAFSEKVGRGEATAEEIAAWHAAHPSQWDTAV